MTNLAVNTTILKTVPLFSLFSDHELATLFPAIQHRSYPRHSFMLRAGEKTDALYIILSGKAKVVIDDGDGREVMLTTIGPSEFFGEMSLIDEKPRSAGVEALEPCEVLYISTNRSGFDRKFYRFCNDGWGRTIPRLQVSAYWQFN